MIARKQVEVAQSTLFCWESLVQWNITDYKEPGDLSFCPIATASLGIKKKKMAVSQIPLLAKFL